MTFKTSKLHNLKFLQWLQNFCTLFNNNNDNNNNNNNNNNNGLFATSTLHGSSCRKDKKQYSYLYFINNKIIF